MTYAVAIFGLFMIIMIHEAGHFLAARAVGIRATKFFIFFPPRLFSFRRGEVEYGIGSIPLGGFVKLPGMFEPQPVDAYWRVAKGVDQLAEACGNDNERVVLRSMLAQVEQASSATELDASCRVLAQQIDTMRSSVTGKLPDRIAQRLRDISDDCHERAYWRAPLWKRMVVILAGPFANIVLALGIFWVVAALLTPVYQYSWKIGRVVKDSPAAVAGVAKNDIIVSWNGIRPGSSARDAERFADTVSASSGAPITLIVRAPGASTKRTYTITPKKLRGDLRIGVLTQVEQRFDHYQRREPVEATQISLRVMVGTSRQVLTGLGRIVNPDNFDEISSVVGIVKIAPAWAKAGNLVGYLGILSLAIAIYNLLPLLPLDGGHVAFGVIERIRRGQPLPRVIFERYSIVGLMLMLSLFFVGLGNDLGLRR